MYFDLVSDIHVEHWDNNYDFLKEKQSNILVVAGDISDDPVRSFEWLSVVSSEYSQILVVDGNHEHQGRGFPLTEINAEFKELCDKIANVHYLADGMFVKDGVAFIGRCGWWNYMVGEPHVRWDQSHTHFTEYAGIEATNAILAQSARDYAGVLEDCLHAEMNDAIQSVVVVTHTLPHSRGVSWNVYPAVNNAVGCYGNSLMENIPVYCSKVKLWCFGHNHDQQTFNLNRVQYISNPRGRPQDFNRETYSPQHIWV